MLACPMRVLLVLSVLFATLFPALGQEAATTPAAPAANADASVDELIRIIENDDSRAVLLERLRQTQAGAEADIPADAPPDLSIARRLAEYTRAVAEGASSTVAAVGRAFGDIGDGFNGTMDADLGLLRDVAIGILLVAAGLFGSFLVLRLCAIWAQKQIGHRIQGRKWPMRVLGIVGGSLIDLASVLLAWAIGYVVALTFVTNGFGRMGINQSLLLNAFLVVELSKLVVRTVLAPRIPVLRILPLNDGDAAYWSFWSGRVISLLGYAFMFVAPILAANVAVGAANVVQVLAMLTAVTIGIVVVLQCKDGLRMRLAAISERREHDALGQALTGIGQYWHLFAITYLIAVLVVWFANPEQALPFMIAATVQSAIAVVLGIVVITFISRFISVGLHLPTDIKQRLPLLETRLHAFVPRVMQIVRFVVIAAVILAVAQAWALFDFVGWIGSDHGQQLAGAVISAALIVLVCIVAHIVVASWVEYRLNTSIGKTPTAREKTLLSLFRNAFTVALVVFGTMLALAQIGVNIAPLLAGAGVVGLAIGFGAQKLVQDIITGIFIQFENIMNEGDVVEAAGKSGVVEKLTIRSVTIRDMSGTVHLIPFSSVDQVSNMVRGFSFYVAEIEVAYDSDIEAVKQTLRDAFAMVMETEHKDVVLDDLDLQGLIAITPASMTLRARIKTLAGKQWGAGRYFSEMVMRLFAERGIETPTQKVSYVQRAPNGKHIKDLPPPGSEEDTSS